MTTSSVSYAQLTYLSGQILGAIGLSILADILGCKKVYLTSMYLATIIGVLISIVQTYRQYILVRLPIAALIQVNIFPLIEFNFERHRVFFQGGVYSIICTYV